MQTYTITDLARLTRAELLALHARLLAKLAALPTGAPDYNAAWDALRLIRSLLSRRGPAP